MDNESPTPPTAHPVKPWHDTRVWLATIGFLTVFSAQAINAYLSLRTQSKVESADKRIQSTEKRVDDAAKAATSAHEAAADSANEVKAVRSEVKATRKEVKAAVMGKEDK